MSEVPREEPEKADHQFRRKPLVIEARQFNGDVESGTAIIRWAHTGLPPEMNAIIRFADLAGYHMLTIRTLKGDMRAVAGDWIIRGIKGEFYPCKPDIFTATYEHAVLAAAPASASAPQEELLSDLHRRLNEIAELQPDAMRVLEKHNFVFRRFPRDMVKEPPINEEERWEALAFTFYSSIVGAHSMANRAIGEIDDAQELAALRPSAAHVSEEIRPYLFHQAFCKKWGESWEWPRHLHPEIDCTCGLDILLSVRERGEK